MTKLIIFGIIVLALIALGKSSFRRQNPPPPDGVEWPRVNKEQLIVLWLGIGLVSLIALFPPWIYTLDVVGGGGSTQSQREAGYHPIFEPPPPQNALDASSSPTYADGVRLDFARIVIQLAVVVLVAGGLFWTLRDRGSGTR